MAGSRTSAPETPAKQEPHAAAPAAPPLPFGLGASLAQKEEKAEESSGDEVCFNERPLFTAGRPARGVLARAKMQSLGCAKKEKVTPQVSVETISDAQGAEGYSKPITSVAPVPNRSVPKDDISDSSEEAEVADDCRWRRGTWWAQFFHLKLLSIGAGAASLKVSMAQMNLTDVDLPSLTSALDRLLLDLRRSTQEDLVESDHWPPVRVSMELDLSDNEISDAGALWLFGWLMQRPNELRCRVLRLARNRLGDLALEWLSALVCQQHSAIEELHLADNAITATGAAHVLIAFALHPFEAYPFLDPRGLFAPVALTLDRNPIQEPGLLARLRLRANLRAACKDGNLRTAKFSLAPHVQLGANFPDAGVSMVLPLALEKVCAGGAWPSLPQLPKPLPKEIEVETTSLGRLKTFRRELMVDDEEGAGLELETVSDGLRICQIFEIPGQPGLRVGDILVAIDGLPLWWKVCQRDKIEIDEDDDAPSARFRARFRRGARLDVMRPAEAVPAPTQAPRSHRFACPVCWDTFNRWNDCLEHLREFGHEPTPVSSKLEDASGSLRRWMATCMAAARGEIPQPDGSAAVPFPEAKPRGNERRNEIRRPLPSPKDMPPGSVRFVSPLDVRFTHDSISECFTPYFKDGVQITEREQLKVLSSAKELLFGDEEPKALEILDVVWYKDNLYVAGTFNRRLCMYRLLALFATERFGMIKVQVKSQDELRQKLNRSYTTKCEGRLVTIRGREEYQVGQCRDELYWPEAVEVLGGSDKAGTAPIRSGSATEMAVETAASAAPIPTCDTHVDRVVAATAEFHRMPLGQAQRIFQNGSLSPEQWMATEEDDTLLLPASIGVLGERSRMVIEALAEEASRFGFEHGCTVWTLPNGLRAQCPSARGSASVASMANELLQIMHFHLPDIDDKESPSEDEELAEWTAWLDQMLQEAEETRQRVAPLSMIETSLEDITEQPDDSIRMVLLCGLPGSGKSTLARSFAKSSKWCVVNQDTLGSRQACLKVARNALTRPPNERGHIVIDRCNVTRSQRGIWTLLASEFHLAPSQVACVWLDVSNTECARRVLQRFGHRTLPPQNASLKVIEGFASKWQAPDVSEGFGRLWRLSSDADQEMFLSDFGLSASEPEPRPETTHVEGPTTVEVAPLTSRKEKAGSNKIVAEPVSVMEVKEVEVPPEAMDSASSTWTCACGEINKLRREVCNNCFAEKTRSPRAPSPSVAVAVAPSTTETAKVEVQISPEPEEVKSSPDLTLSADFWRLPLEPLEDLSPP